MKIEENWADVFIYIIEFKPLSNFRELKKITRTIVIEEELSIEEVKELFLKNIQISNLIISFQISVLLFVV